MRDRFSSVPRTPTRDDVRDTRNSEEEGYLERAPAGASVRYATSLTDRSREIAILVVAAQCRCAYYGSTAPTPRGRCPAAAATPAVPRPLPPCGRWLSWRPARTSPRA